MALNGDVIAALQRLTTATITTVLLKKGMRNVWIRRAMSLDPHQPRVVGPAFTLRFVPGREDLATPESLASPTSTRFAIEEMPEGCIAVVDAAGITDAGIFGDILCARMKKRGVRALVTDGAIRDIEGVKQTALPVWCSGISAPPSFAHLTFVGWQQPIGCGGVAVLPNEMIVADQDGAVVIPEALVETVIELGSEGEALEEWILKQVENGEKLPGLYPPSEQKAAEYQAARRRASAKH
jgi:regulator of RNase E activity RraA